MTILYNAFQLTYLKISNIFIFLNGKGDGLVELPVLGQEQEFSPVGLLSHSWCGHFCFVFLFSFVPTASLLAELIMTIASSG